MQTGSFLIIGVLLVTLQTSVLQLLPKWLGSPDLVFIEVAFLAYRFDAVRGLFLAFLFGWLMDVVSGIYLGMYLVTYPLVFLGFRTITLKSPIKESAYQVPLVGVIYFLSQVILYFIIMLSTSDSLVAWSWSRMVRETMLLTVATIPCFLLFNSLLEYVQKKKSMARVSRRSNGNRYR